MVVERTEEIQGDPYGNTPPAALAPRRLDNGFDHRSKPAVYIPLPCLRMELPGGTPAALPPPCHCAFSFGCTKSCDASHRGHLAMARCLWSNPMGSFHVRGAKNPRHRMMSGIFGDPYGNRTHITAVKGRCLNLLTNGPGSGNLTRTDDTPGMNRMLYQLSYAAIMIACRISRAGCIIKDSGDFVNRILKYFQKIFCIVPPAGTY